MNANENNGEPIRNQLSQEGIDTKTDGLARLRDALDSSCTSDDIVELFSKEVESLSIVESMRRVAQLIRTHLENDQ